MAPWSGRYVALSRKNSLLIMMQGGRGIQAVALWHFVCSATVGYRDLSCIGYRSVAESSCSYEPMYIIPYPGLLSNQMKVTHNLRGDCEGD